MIPTWLFPKESFHLDDFLPCSDDVLVDAFCVILRVVATLPDAGRLVGAALLVQSASGTPHIDGGSYGTRRLRRDVVLALDPLWPLATLCLLLPLRTLDVDGCPTLGTRGGAVAVRGTSSMTSDLGWLTRLISRASFWLASARTSTMAPGSAPLATDVGVWLPLLPLPRRAPRLRRLFVDVEREVKNALPETESAVSLA